MTTAAYEVRIERHEVGEMPVWAFTSNPPPAHPPLVVVLHGLNSRKERHLDLCLRLADAGFRAAALDARSHGDRNDADTDALRQGWTTPEFGAAFARAVAGTAEDVATLATYFGASEYAVIGHSMGGYIATLAALADARASVVVNIAGSLDVAALSEDGGKTADTRKWDPAARAAELYPRAVLLLHGEVDKTVPVRGAHRLNRALAAAYAANPERAVFIEYAGVGHELPPQMAEEAVAWVRKHLAPEGKSADDVQPA
jgi:alpha-beta hydrolase superfamily lysophospholipase